ncbi:MAG: AAA family ATPase, partial [Desulfovibrio sp.]|nr:AAA family ATPase [Desulfovibrio sp.]
MNKLLKISITNFRSIRSASLDFSQYSPITVLTGLNGSGKSTILYMIDFVSSIFRGDVDVFLDKHSWTSTDIINK